MGLIAQSYIKKGKRINRPYMSCLFLSLIVTVPSLFGEEILTLYNNTIYPVTAEVEFCKFITRYEHEGCDPVLSYNLAPEKRERIKIPTDYGLVYIKATVPAQHEPIIASGKVVGSKIKRQEKSAILKTHNSDRGKFGVVSGKAHSSATFVINANRNLSFINGIEHVQNLAIYRFIQ